MKHIAILFLVAALCAAAIAHGQGTVRTILTCDAPPATEQIDGYVLYRRTTPTAAWERVQTFQGTTREFLIPVPIVGGSQYALTAYNAAGESDISDPITMPGRAGKPVNPRVTIEFQ